MSSKSLPNVLDFDLPALKTEFERRGVEKFRAAQVSGWIYKKGVYDFDAMKNLSADVKKKLVDNFSIGAGSIKKRSHSAGDSSVKLLVELPDHELVETVYIPKGRRRTVCVSSQVGCKFKCGFCASGQAGFFRNLSASEIVAQILRARDESKVSNDHLTNIVFMGIGEPLDNYDNVVKAIRTLNSPDGLGIGARRITISTCGVVPRIRQLAGEGMQIELSVSLHGANDSVRTQLMPVNRAWPIHELLAACGEYTLKTKRDITFEYILADGLNADIEDARQLALVLEGIQCKVNLIPLNPIPEFPYTRPTNARIIAFQKMLAEKKIKSTVRYSSGTDINAACGQLRSVEMSKAQEK